MMEKMRRELPSLLELAHDHSEGARLQLANKLADLFLSDDIELNQREEAMVNELIKMLIKTEDVAVRHELVKRFAEVKDMPRNVAFNLASSVIDFAASILKHAKSLTDDDLITIIEMQSPEHACAVASRQEISEAVADALVTTGSLQVMQTVAENLGAKLSPKAVGILTETARLVVSLQWPIMKRPELTPDMASKLYWWVTQDLRRHAIERYGFSAGLLDLALAKAIEVKLNEHIFERHEDAAMIHVADWLDERNSINIALLPKLLRLGHFRLFNIALGRLSQLELAQIDIIMAESGGRLLAAICRSLGIDKPSFVSIFLLSRAGRSDEHLVHPKELSLALAAYDKLQPATAQDMVRGWRADPESLNRYSEQTA